MGLFDFGKKSEPAGKVDFKPELPKIDWHGIRVVFLPHLNGEDNYTVAELIEAVDNRIKFKVGDDVGERLLDQEIIMANLPTGVDDIGQALSWGDLRRRVALLKNGGIAVEDGRLIPSETLLEMVRMGEEGEIEVGNEESEFRVTSTGGLRGVIVDLIKNNGHRPDVQLRHG
jgi:hypothetical protein